MEKGTNRLKGAVGSLAGTVGITGLAFGIKDVVEAGEKWQFQQAQLTNALEGHRPVLEEHLQSGREFLGGLVQCVAGSPARRN